MAHLEEKRNEIEYYGYSIPSYLSLVPQKSNWLITLFRKLRKLFGFSDNYEKIRN